MAKLKCDNPECEAFDQELDTVEVQITTMADYNSEKDDYDFWIRSPCEEYVLACPKCGTPLSEP